MREILQEGGGGSKGSKSGSNSPIYKPVPGVRLIAFKERQNALYSPLRLVYLVVFGLSGAQCK